MGARLYNASTFEAAMRSRGVVIETCAGIAWETLGDDGKWMPYDGDINIRIEEARVRGQSTVEVWMGPKGWKYEIDTCRMVQRNSKTRKERPIRCTKAPPSASASSSTSLRPGKLTHEELMEAIKFYVELETLPATAPSSASGLSSSSSPS